MSNTIAPEKLKSLINAINSPDFSHTTERVVGFIGIYHKDSKSSTGVTCVESLPSEFAFLLGVFGKTYNQNLEFGMSPYKNYGTFNTFAK